MSSLHRLKAYFGMVPADELDDYGPEYDSGYGVDYDYDPDPLDRTRAYHAEWAVPRRPRRRVLAEQDGRGRYQRDDHYVEPAAASLFTPRRPGWSTDAAPVRGALAVDAAPPMREPVREPVREPAREPLPRHHPFTEEDGHPLARIVTLHPRTYNEARSIGERYREGAPVIMNLTEMDDADAKRLVDFAAGLAFALRGSIDKVTAKVFLLSPVNVAVSAEDKRRIAEGGCFSQP